MRNLFPFSGDSFQFYCEIRDSLKCDKSRDIKLNEIHNELRDAYVRFDANFEKNVLSSTSPMELHVDTKKVLKNLYWYRRQKIAQLYKELTTGEYNRLSNKCPYCSLGEVSSFDHFLPKAEFSEFSVHPRNLIPACGKCNMNKGNFYKGIINLYKDDLPKEKQYLFVNLTLYDSWIKADFYIGNESGIGSDLFNKIKRTFEVLKLNERYKQSSDDQIMKVLEYIKLKKNSLRDKLQVKDDLLIEFRQLNISKDVNDWRYVFRKACLENTQVYDYLWNS